MFLSFSVNLVSWMCFLNTLRTLFLLIISVSTSLSQPQETCCYVEAHRIPGDEYSLHDSYTGELFSLNYAAHLQKLLTYPGMIKSSPL